MSRNIEVERELSKLYHEAEKIVLTAETAGVLTNAATRIEALRSVVITVVARDIQRLSDLVGESK